MPRDKNFRIQQDFSYFDIYPVPQRLGFSFHHKFLTVPVYNTVVAELVASPVVAVDTETTGLAFADCELVTVQLSYRVGMEVRSYCCLYHLGYARAHFAGRLDKLPSRSRVLSLVKLALSRPTVVMHNRPFDQRVLLNATLWRYVSSAAVTMADDCSATPYTDNPLSRTDFFTTVDTLDMAFQMDSNVLSGNGLKQLAKTYLGLPMDSYDDSVGSDILITPPKRLLVYACLDTYATLGLYLLFAPRFKSRCPFLFKLLVPHANAFYDLCEQTKPVDFPTLESMYKKNLDALEAVKTEFFSKYGIIKLSSNYEKSELLSRLGYFTGKWAAPKKDGTPVMSCSADLLEKLAAKGCDAASLMVKYNKLVKLSTAFYLPLLSAKDSGRPSRVYLNANRAPTLRYAGGSYKIKGKDYGYFLPVNLLAVPKPKTCFRSLSYDPDTMDFHFREEGVRVEGEYLVEVGKDKDNFRSVFKAPDGYVLVKADFNGEENRVGACLSGETVWIESYLHGKDIHRNTAASLYNVPYESVTTEQRKAAKTATFMLQYALPGSYFTLMDKFGYSESEAMDFERSYRDALPRFYAWKEREYRKAFVNRYATNLFCHVRPLGGYLDARQNGYVKKTSVSHAIQGLCGVITRIFMVKFWRLVYGPDRVFNRDVPDNLLGNHDLMDVYFNLPIYDEVSFFCRKPHAVRVARMIKSVMEGCTPPGFQIPLRADLEMGPDFGHLVEAKIVEIDGVERLVPDFNVWHERAVPDEPSTAEPSAVFSPSLESMGGLVF